MATLLEKANLILQERKNKIIPENLKDGVTAFSIEGLLKGGEFTEDFRMFSSVQQMQDSTGNEEGDSAIVFKNDLTNLKARTKNYYNHFPLSSDTR